MGPPPGKKPKKAKPKKTPKPKKDPKPQKPKKGRKSKETPPPGEPEETPLVGHQGEDPLMGEQDPALGNAPVPRTTPRPGDTDPLEDETSPLRPEGKPTPLGTDQDRVDVGSIPLPPGPLLSVSTNSTAGASDTANATNARESHVAANPRA